MLILTKVKGRVVKPGWSSLLWEKTKPKSCFQHISNFKKCLSSRWRSINLWDASMFLHKCFSGGWIAPGTRTLTFPTTDNLIQLFLWLSDIHTNFTLWFELFSKALFNLDTTISVSGEQCVSGLRMTILITILTISHTLLCFTVNMSPSRSSMTFETIINTLFQTIQNPYSINIQHLYISFLVQMQNNARIYFIIDVQLVNSNQ